MAAIGLDFNDGEAGNVSDVCRKSNHRTRQDVEAILVEADLPNAATKATRITTIDMEKSLRMPDKSPRKQIATAEVRQRT